MFKETGMSPDRPEDPSAQPDGELDRLFASEEAAIFDDGFTRRIVQKTRAHLAWRQTAIYGAGLAGFGFAVGGIADMAPYLPPLTGWWNGVSGALQTVPDPTLMALSAVVAGVTFLLAAVAAQSR